MKKLFYLIAATVLVISCSDDGLFNSEQTEKNPTKISLNRSVDDAISIAENILSSRGTISRSDISIDKSAVHVIDAPVSRSGSSDTLLYAVDMGEDNGFVIVSAPKTVEPIMAIIDKGSYNDPANLQNEAYQQTLDIIKNNVHKAGIIDRPIEPDTFKLEIITDLAVYWDTIDIRRLHQPTVEIALGSTWPENIFAANGKSGCVPVAIAQVLSVFEQPTSMNYTFNSRDINSETLNWSEIKKHKKSSESDFIGCDICSATHDTHQTIGRILRQIGQLAGSDYSNPEATSTFESRITPTVRQLINRNPDKYSTGLNNLFNELDSNEGVAIISAKNITNPADPSYHSWIADATRHIHYCITRYKYDHIIKNYVVDTNIVCQRSQMIHFNWGRSGRCNGWFNLGTLCMGEGVEYDFPNEFNGLPYNYDANTVQFWFYKK